MTQKRTFYTVDAVVRKDNHIWQMNRGIFISELNPKTMVETEDRNRRYFHRVFAQKKFADRYEQKLAEMLTRQWQESLLT